MNFNISNGEYKPYLKPNNIPVYVNITSNHPPLVLKQIPLGAESRLNAISCNEEVFNKAAIPYQEALEKAGHEYKLKWVQKTQKKQQKNKPRVRKVTWYNPPYNTMAKENIGIAFKKAIKKHIPKGHPLYTVINEHVTKLSYSIMPNKASKIGAHNNKTEGQNQNSEKARLCSFPNTKGKKPFKWPFKNKCLEQGIIYQATNSNFNYIGLTKGNLKDRISKHENSFYTLKKNQIPD